MRTEDDRLVTEFRAMLDGVDRTLAQRRPSSAPWAEIQQFIAASRIRRGWRIAVAVTAAAMAVVSILVLQNRLFPASDRGQAPVPTGPPFAQWDQPRGSLAGDQTWLGQFREYARTHWAENDGVSSRPFRRMPGKDIKVLYASDVGDWRIGVVIGEWPAEKERMVAEFYGRRGAPVEDMLAGNIGPAPELTAGSDTYWNALSSMYSPRGLSPAKVREMKPSVYLLTDGAPEALVQEPPTIDADGKVTQHTRQITFHDGFAELTFDRPGHYAVVLPNRDHGYSFPFVEENAYRDFFVGSQPGQFPADAVNPVPARGGADREDTVPGLARLTWSAVRQPVSGGAWRLLTSAPGNLTSQDPARPVVGVLTLPSGARVLAAGRLFAQSQLAIDGSGKSRRMDFQDSRLDIARLLPAGDDAQDSIAWWMDATDHEPARAAAMGPAGTVKVRWTTTGGEEITTGAVSTLGLIDRRDVTEARFLAADGTELGRTKVLVPTAERYNPDTSRDKGDSSWILPEVADGLAGF